MAQELDVVILSLYDISK